jgi:signal transduction histidine kinase/CheY-like chemotaxis protein
MRGSAEEHALINDPAVRGQALKFLFAELPGITTIQFSFPVAVVAMYWDYVDNAQLLGWMVCLFALYAIRLALARSFNRQINQQELNIERWGGYFTVTSLAAGTLWGSAGALFYVPDQATLVTLLYVIIIGTAAGQIILTANWLPALYAYSCTALGILSLNLLLRGDGAQQVLAVLLLLFLVMIIRIARQARRMIYEGIALRFENLKLMRQFQDEKRIAEQANMAKTRFLASANHDLRQPVQAIKMFAHALKPELVSQRSKVLFNDFDASIRSLSDLLEALLDLSKLDAGVIAPTLSDFKLNTVFNQLLREFLPMARAKQLKYSVRPTPIALTSDPTLLADLLRNLLSNAFCHVSSGGVLMGARIRGDSCVIEVWDTGPGISNEERVRIFEPFYQINNPERDKSQGLGLGLAICKQLAGILHAELNFCSRLGTGTVFRLTLFRSQAAPDDIQSVTGNINKPQRGTTSGRHVLVVDDNQQVLTAMQAALESMGMTCDTANGLEQAIHTIQHQRVPDHILCDHRLRGGLTSLDLIRWLERHIKQPPPMIVITGDTSPDRLLEARMSGRPVLHKPIDMDALQQIMLEQRAD